MMRALFPGLVFLLAYGSVHAVEPVAPPNIVVIISDDQGYGDYGFMGHEVIQTPRLDRLAQESLLFTRGYVTTALCSPSLATMLTGQYPHQHGITGNDPANKKPRGPWIERFARSPQLPALLGEAGYLSLHTGKYWQGDPAVSGFTHSMGATGRHGSEESLGIGRNGMQPIYDFIAEAQSQQKPFLVWYAPFLPHTPHTPPERLLAKYRGKGGSLANDKYFAMCEWLDETCGQLLDHLDSEGLSENTLVLYLCDNGWGSVGKGSVKATPHELGVRTPIMIRWPGRVEPRREETSLASNLDLAPTVLRACGEQVPAEMEGIDLRDERAVTGRETLFLENFAHDMLDAERPAASLRARSLIKGHWKLTLWQDPQPELVFQNWRMLAPKEKILLFDLARDPLQQRNLAAEQPEKVASMRADLDAWWATQGSVKDY
jgi:uncharacterized sulfatase